MRRIASGGMAEVWMGRRHAMGGASKTVAIKLLASHLASNQTYQRMFVDEARLTMMLTHSNIVQVFDVGEDGGRSYLVMEWIDGLDLSRLAASMRDQGAAFELHIVAHVVGELLRALAYAHGLIDGDARSTIVHRDISPHNVLISVSGEVKLSDFGVARLASEETSGVHVRGKLRYMPPEQVRGDSKHATTDLFAVGAVMQELLDGVRFRAGLERDELFGMVIQGAVPPLRRAAVPPELVALRDALLASDRKDRVQSAAEALELLRRWPGYRNAADELAELVRSQAGVAAPRSGLTVEISDDLLEPSDEPTVREHSSADEGDDSQLATRTVRSDDVGSPAHVRERRRARLPAVLGLSVASLGIGLGFAYAWLHDGPAAAAGHVERVERVAPVEPVEPPASLAPSRAGEVALVDADEPGVDVEDVEDPPSSERADAELAASEPTLAATREPAPELTAKPKASAPAEVEFAAHEFFFVWIKVAGRTQALEPTAKLSLPPGRHKVSIRQRADQPWQSAGSIKIASGQRYRVSLRKPHALALTPVR